MVQRHTPSVSQQSVLFRAPAINKRVVGVAKPDMELARWFVETILEEPFDTLLHERQIFAAEALLRSGYAISDVKGAVLAFRRGGLACQDYRPRQLVSLLALTSDIWDDLGRATSPMKEYLHAQKVLCYRERSEVQEAMTLREGTFFNVGLAS